MFRPLFYLLLFMTACRLPVQSQSIQSFTTHFGTLELIAEPGHGYIFRSDKDEEEIFDISLNEFFLSKKGSFPGIPNLKEIGFKLDNGAEYLYRTKTEFRSEVRTAQLAGQENPGHKMVSRIFEGEAKSRLEIMLSGKTPVIRVDLQIEGRTITLWSPRKDDAPKK